MIVVNKTTVAPPPPITVNFIGLQIIYPHHPCAKGCKLLSEKIKRLLFMASLLNV